jgi:hypothetical protein
MGQGSVARGGRNSEMVSTAREIQEITRWMISNGIIEKFNLYRHQ